MKHNIKTAILLFSRSAQRESHTKGWTKDHLINGRIAQKLINETHSKLEKTPYPIFFFDETLQSGDSFAERLINGFKYVFSHGFSFVIAVGNDCPSLNPDHFQKAHQLQEGEVLLGPDCRGGVYMIGIGADSDFESKFKKISWHSNQVFEQLKSLFPENHILESRQDINTFDDAASCKILFDWLKKILIKPSIATTFGKMNSFFYAALQPLRAPPISTDFI